MPKCARDANPRGSSQYGNIAIYTNGAVGGVGVNDQGSTGNDSLDGLLDTVKAMNQPITLKTVFYVQMRRCAEAILTHGKDEERQMQIGVNRQR